MFIFPYDDAVYGLPVYFSGMLMYYNKIVYTQLFKLITWRLFIQTVQIPRSPISHNIQNRNNTFAKVDQGIDCLG